MPIYEYKCLECMNVFEYIHTSSPEHKVIQCPNCHSKESKVRIMSNISKPVFKGSGFYETDYKKK